PQRFGEWGHVLSTTLRTRDPYVLAWVHERRGELDQRAPRRMELAEPEHHHQALVRQQRQGASEADRCPAGWRAAGHHLPVWLFASTACGGARPGRSHSVGAAARRELE